MVEILKRLLGERGIEIDSEKLQPDGGKRLVLRKGDGATLEITLTRNLLRGKRNSAIEYIEQLFRERPHASRAEPDIYPAALPG